MNLRKLLTLNYFFRILVSTDAPRCHPGHSEQHPTVRCSGLHTEHTVASSWTRPDWQADKWSPRLFQSPLYSQWTRQGCCWVANIFFFLAFFKICFLTWRECACVSLQHPASVYGRIATASLAETVRNPAPCDSVQEASGHSPSEPLSSKSNPDEGILSWARGDYTHKNALYLSKLNTHQL